MAILFDQATTLTAFSASNISMSHTPVGIPAGVVVSVVQNNTTANITSVTYGGSALTQIGTSPYIGTTGEPTVMHIFFLGSAVPSGTQTAVITNAVGAGRSSTVMTLTSPANIEVNAVSSLIEQNTGVNPSAVFALGAQESFVFELFTSGSSSTGNTTPNAGWTSTAEGDLGSLVSGLYTYDTVDSADVTCGYANIQSEDCHLIGVALQEEAAAAGVSITTFDDGDVFIGETGLILTGVDFEATTGTLTLSPTDDINDAGAVVVTTTAWSDTSITFDMPSSIDLLYGIRYAFITTDTLEVNAAGKSFSLSPEAGTSYVTIEEQNDLGVLLGTTGLQLGSDQLEFGNTSSGGGAVYIGISGTVFITDYAGAVPSSDTIEIRLGDDSDSTWSSTSSETITIQGDVSTVVNATLPTLTLTPLNTTVTALVDTNVDATLDTLTLTSLNTTVTALVDTNVDATLDTLTLTSLNTTVTALVDTNVDATLDTLTLTSLNTTVTEGAAANTWVVETPGGTADLLGPTLGNLLSSKVRVVVEHVTWATTGYLFSQAHSTSSLREIGLFIQSGDYRLIAGGTVNVLATVVSFPLVDSTIDLTVDYVAETAILICDETEMFNGSITVGVGRSDGENFRMFGRRGGYRAPSGTRVGNTEIYIDDVLTRDYDFDNSNHGAQQVDVDELIVPANKLLATNMALDGTPWIGALAVTDTLVNATLDTLTLTPLNATITALADTNINTTLDTLTLTPLNATVTDLEDLTVNATLDTLTLTPLNTSITVNEDTLVNATLDTLTLTPLNTSITVNEDTLVNATLDTLTLTPLNTSITVNEDTLVNATLDTLTITPLNTSITVNEDTLVNATLDTLTLTPLNTFITVNEDTLVNATLDTLTLTPLNTSITVNEDTLVNATLDTLTLTPLNTTVTALIDTNVNATLDTLTLTPLNTAVTADNNINATLDTLTLTPLNPSITVGSNISINASLPTLTLTPLNTTVTALVSTDIDATLDTLTLTPLSATVTDLVDLEVNTTLDTLTLTPLNTAVTSLIDTNISTTLPTLTLTPLNTTVTVGQDIVVNATLDTLTLTPLNTTVTVLIGTDISATLDTLTLTPLSATVTDLEDLTVNATLDTLTLTPLNTNVTDLVNTTVNATLDTLTLTPLNVTITRSTFVNTTLATLTLTPLNTIITSAQSGTVDYRAYTEDVTTRYKAISS